MAHSGNVRVLVLMHYHGSFPNHMIDEDLLGQALSSRGLRGQIVEVEGLADVPEGSEEVAKRSVDQMTCKGWQPVVDAFQAAVGSFKHDIIVYGDS